MADHAALWGREDGLLYVMLDVNSGGRHQAARLRSSSCGSLSVAMRHGSGIIRMKAETIIGAFLSGGGSAKDLTLVVPKIF